ncbi:glycosyltransferase [Pseudocitrobacter faecalis]|nr:glycosyltransferase [Pseudocitrobacter faecalis]
MNAPVLSIVVPCYNEEEVFNLCLSELSLKIKEMVEAHKIDSTSHIVFVDDGSKDKTWTLIENNARINPLVKGVKLSRNKGHQTALMAGLSSCIDSDITVSIDADLQDDTSVIEKWLMLICQEMTLYMACAMIGLRIVFSRNSQLRLSIKS